jgi:hypothetical protein
MLTYVNYILHCVTEINELNYWKIQTYLLP